MLPSIFFHVIYIFYTFEAVFFFFDKILQSLYYAIAYPIVYTVCVCYTICAIELEATIRDKRRNFMFQSISNVILACSFSSFLFSLQKNPIHGAGKETLTERFFSGSHVKLLFVITLFYFHSHFFSSSSSCIISYSFALFLSVSQQSQWT